MNQTLRWEAYEYEYRDKRADWYWALWIIVIATATTAIILNNISLGVLLVVAGAMVTLFSRRMPRVVEFEINEQGVLSHGAVYDFKSLESFHVDERGENNSRILIKSKKKLMPLLVIPLGGVQPEEVRQILVKRLPQEEISESLVQIFADYLGF